MKIVRIIARLNVGGPAQHVVWLTARARASGHDALLVTGSVPAGERSMERFAARHGVTPLCIPEMSRELSPRDVRVVWKLFRLFVRERPDVIHTHTAKAGAVGRAAALLYRVVAAAPWNRWRRPLVVHTYHGHVFHSYYGRWRTALFLLIERLLARLVTDRIVVISPRQLTEIHEHFRIGRPWQFAVIPLGLELERFEDDGTRRQAARARLGLGSNDRVVAIVGRLTEIKNHVLFLDAVAHLTGTRAADADPVRFVIVGDGHLRAPLEAHARDRGIATAVRFLGDRDDLDVLYHAFDLVVLTSRNEGTPLTLIEAMACGIPFVSTDVGGVPDLAGGRMPETVASHISVCEHGLLVHRPEPAVIAEAIDAMMRQPAWRLRSGHRSRVFARARYDVRRLVADVLALYSEQGGQRQV